MEPGFAGREFEESGSDAWRTCLPGFGSAAAVRPELMEPGLTEFWLTEFDSMEPGMTELVSTKFAR